MSAGCALIGACSPLPSRYFADRDFPDLLQASLPDSLVIGANRPASAGDALMP